MNLQVKTFDTKWEIRWNLAQTKAHLKYRDTLQKIEVQLESNLDFWLKFLLASTLI